MAIAPATVAMSLFILLSCGGKSKDFASAITSRDSTAVMTTRGISSSISENGQIKYHIIAGSWEVFDQAKPPYQAFEDSAYLEVYDSAMNVVSIIRADTAYYYDESKIWELRGNVHSENSENERFDTQLLYWNQQRETVYSDARIKIRQENQIIEGVGFDSNQDFTRYTIRKTEGIFPVRE